MQLHTPHGSFIFENFSEASRKDSPGFAGIVGLLSLSIEPIRKILRETNNFAVLTLSARNSKLFSSSGDRRSFPSEIAAEADFELNPFVDIDSRCAPRANLYISQDESDSAQVMIKNAIVGTMRLDATAIKSSRRIADCQSGDRQVPGRMSPVVVR